MLRQFLAEAVFLSVTGRIAGIVLGVAFPEGVSVLAGRRAPASLLAIVGGFLVSAAVDVIFGCYPARKAAQLDPIKALRYE